jgi:cytochrome P450 family 135
VKKVFTADHAVLGVGLANSILGPLLGPRSVMLLEEPEHVKRRKRKRPFPRRADEGLQRDDL